MLSIRDSRFLTKIFPGLAQLLCKLADDHIALLGENLMQIAQLLPLNPQLSIDNPQIQNTLSQLEVI